MPELHQSAPASTQVLEPRWIIPVEPEGTVLEDHAVVVSGSVIEAVLPRAEAARRHADAVRVPMPGHVLIPGLVNAHTHAAMTLFRGMADDLPLMTWLEQHIWPAEARHANAGFVADGTRIACAELLLGGVTCANDMYFFPAAAAEAAIELGLRMALGLIVIEFPTAYAASADQYFARGIEVHDRFRHHPLITTTWAPHAPYTVSDASLERIAMLAEELDIPIHMHVHETAHEIAASLETHGVRPLARLDRLGLLSPRLMAVHMTQLTADEILRLAETGPSVVHCPESNLKLASGLAPIGALLAAGVNVALGTDGAASNNDLDLLGEMRTAALLAKFASSDPAVFPAAAALRAATLGGARALGLEELIGSIAAGKSADLVAIDLADISTQPVHEPTAAVVYAASRRQVSDVWVRGCRVVQDGRLLTADLATLRASAGRWLERIRAG